MSDQPENLQILLIEDNPEDERLIVYLLNEAFPLKLRIFTAKTLADGLARLTQSKLDLVLLGLSLPDSHGLDTFLTTQMHSPYIPIIVLTGSDDDGLALEALQLGAQDYLSKGALDSKTLKRSIQYAILRHKLEEKLHLQATALQSADNIVFITDQNGVIQWVNPAFTQVTGYSLEEAMGSTPRLLKSGQHPLDFYENMWQAIRSGQVWHSEVTNRRKDGSLFIVEQTVTPFSGHNSHITNFVAIQQDITARKQAEDAENQRIRELEALHRVSQEMRDAEKLDEALSLLLDEALAALDLTSGEIWIHDALSHTLHQVVARGWCVTVPEKPVRPNEGITGTVFASGVRHISREFFGDPLLREAVRNQIPPGWGGACIPIPSQKDVLGVLLITTQLPREITAFEIKLLESMAEIAGATIHRLQLVTDALRDARNFRIINDVGQTLAESLALDEIYHRLQYAVYELIPSSSAVIFSLYDQDSHRLVPVFANEQEIVQDVSHIKPVALELVEDSLQSQVIRSRQPVIANWISKDDQQKVGDVWFGKTTPPDTRSELIVPMLAKDRVIGLINLQSPAADYFSREHANLLSVVGNTAAVAIENARLFEQTQTRLQRINSLRTIDIAITKNSDIHQTLEIILNQTITQLGADAASVLLFNRTDQTLEFASGQGFFSKALQHTRLPFGEGYAGRAAQVRRCVQVDGLDARRTDFLRSPLFSSEGFVVYFGVPLIAKDEVQGVLEVFMRSTFTPEAEWMDFLEALAGQAAIAIDNARLLDDLEKSNVSLLEAYDATIEGWSRALDYRDKETEDHTKRVTEMTLALARTMGITDEQRLVSMRWGSLLHDIGKIGIPDSILHKTDMLTDEEWNIIRQHPSLAFEMLKPIEFLHSALDIPYCHHEKWDGTGYPQGWKGDQIPLAARIFAVIDVWDALRSDRPYRPGWPEDKTLAYIRQQAGTHFDPQIVTAFENLLSMMGNQIEASNFTLPCLLIVIDDERITRSLAQRLRDTFIILLANSGKEALETLRHEKVSVILSDQRMPDMTGIEFLRRAQEIRPSIPGILLSSYSSLVSEAPTSNLDNLRGIITQPYDIEKLIQQITRIVQKNHSLHQQLKLN